jgi:hypothetical protein
MYNIGGENWVGTHFRRDLVYIFFPWKRQAYLENWVGTHFRRDLVYILFPWKRQAYLENDIRVLFSL